MVDEGIVSLLTSFFSPLSILDDEDWRLVRTKSEIRVYPSDFLLHSKEKPLDSVIFMLDGLVNVYTSVKGKGDLLLFFVKQGTGCVFAAPKLIENVRMDFLFRTAKESRILLMPQDLFHSFERKHPDLYEQVDRLLALRLERIVSIMELVAFSPLEERLRAYMRSQMEAYGSNILRLSHESISRDIGTRREVVSRILSYYKDIGVVSLFRQRIEILDPGYFMA